MSPERKSPEQQWRMQLGRILNTSHVTEKLGVDGARLAEMQANGELLALPWFDGSTVFPVFQFRGNGRPHADLPQVLKIFEGVVATPFTTAGWLTSPQDGLDGKTPAQWLRTNGDLERLLQEARVAADEMRD